MSSPVFTITATSSGGTARTSPARKRAAPTPPASATTARDSGCGGIRSGGRPGRCIPLHAQLAQLVLELGQAIGDRGDVARRVALLRRALGVADVVAERCFVGGDQLLELGDARIEPDEARIGRGCRRRGI